MFFFVIILKIVISMSNTALQCLLRSWYFNPMVARMKDKKEKNIRVVTALEQIKGLTQVK